MPRSRPPTPFSTPLHGDSAQETVQAGDPIRPANRPARANNLDGSTWTRHSISVWSDIRRTADEARLGHPAMYPSLLAERVIACFCPPGAEVVLDPFCGSGSTLVAAHRCGLAGVGFDVCADYLELARARLAALPDGDLSRHRLYEQCALSIPETLAPESVDLCVTSPPYWDILQRKRTADRREVRDYNGHIRDLSRAGTYEEFLDGLARVFCGAAQVLRPGAYCVINVMDLRKKSRFYPLHSDLAARLDRERGGPLIFDDLVIWDRRGDYNSLRPLGYPTVFRINKVHEYLLIFQKPRR